MAYVIGVDCGTSGTKTVLFDEKGTVISSVTIEYPMYQPKNGYAEQEPADWANAMINTIKAVMTKSGVNKEDVAGIGISGQMHGLVMLDKDNNVLRKSIIWCDQRTAAEVEEMNEKLGREKLIKITANPALTGWTAAKILWVKNNEPDIYEKCRHILLPKDYLRFILTGEYATEVSDASGMQLLDVPNRCWSKEVCDTLGIDMPLRLSEQALQRTARRSQLSEHQALYSHTLLLSLSTQRAEFTPAVQQCRTHGTLWVLHKAQDFR